MLTIGDRFPAFRLKGVVSNDVPRRAFRAARELLTYTVAVPSSDT